MLTRMLRRFFVAEMTVFLIFLSFVGGFSQVIQPFSKNQLSRDDRILFKKLSLCSNEAVWGMVTGKGYTNVFTNELKIVARPDLRMIGRARTVRVIPYRKDLLQSSSISDRLGGDNVIHLTFRAAEETQAGDILVIDAGGIDDSGNLGDQMYYRFLAQGCAGLVVFGAIRDLEEIYEANSPVYVSAAHAAGAFRIMSIDYQVPVNIGGAVVAPGDILLGDREGIVVIPAEAAAEIADRAYERSLEEEFYRGLLKQGRSLIGLHPPDADVRALWEEYKRSHPFSIED